MSDGDLRLCSGLLLRSDLSTACACAPSRCTVSNGDLRLAVTGDPEGTGALFCSHNLLPPLCSHDAQCPTGICAWLSQAPTCHMAYHSVLFSNITFSTACTCPRLLPYIDAASDGDLRLAGGSATSGRLEIYSTRWGIWGECMGRDRGRDL